jgi:hypothetical protein
MFDLDLREDIDASANKVLYKVLYSITNPSVFKETGSR